MEENKNLDPDFQDDDPVEIDPEFLKTIEKIETLGERHISAFQGIGGLDFSKFSEFIKASGLEKDQTAISILRELYNIGTITGNTSPEILEFTQWNPPIALSKKRKVILVDDNDSSRHFVKQIIEPEYDVIDVVDMETGMIAMTKENPDIIILDINMPLMDYGMVKTLMEQKSPEIPVIMISMHKTEEKDFLSLGAIDYLTKPFSTEQLLKKLDEIKKRTNK